MRVIHKKIWPKWFKLMRMGRKNVEFRLADFRIRPGDTLVLEEWNPKKKKYTGKSLKKKVKRVTRINPLGFYTAGALKKYGCYLIEF
jgi:ASC-1-like (ASCH) protein